METFFNRLNTKIWVKCIKSILCKTAGIKKLFCNNKETPMCAPLSL